MKNVYFRELSFISLDSLARQLRISFTGAGFYLNALLNKGIVRPVRRTGTELSRVDLTESTNNSYQFVYVGLFVIKNYVFVVSPKYMTKQEDIDPAMRQLLDVFSKVASSTGSLSNPEEELISVDDRLSVILQVLLHYEKYGCYFNYFASHQNNGFGEIDWQRTISTEQPVMVDGTPVYLNFKTKHSHMDASDYVTRVHRVVLAECSRLMRESSLATYFSVQVEHFSEYSIEDLGDQSYIIARLEREMDSQFITWKVQILELLRSYFSRCLETLSGLDNCSIGSRSFHQVWETACRFAFGDLLSKPLRSLGLALTEKWIPRAGDSLLSILPHPAWILNDGHVLRARQTFIPDIVTFDDINTDSSVFCIIDAKYYLPRIGSTIENAPGVESVTKQFLYQSAYKDFISDLGFSKVRNCFVMPSQNGSVRRLADITFEEIFREDSPFSSCIEVWCVPPSVVFEAFLSEENIFKSVLNRVL